LRWGDKRRAWRNPARPRAFGDYSTSIRTEKTMEKTTFGLLAALGAAVVAPNAASAAVTPTDRILNPMSVAELLDPVADPVATLNALQSERQLEAVEVDDTMVAQDMMMHHHHHHHRFMMMRHHHHHHHHFFRQHHHHHHNSY
jgi:hypothetical protein